MTLTSLDTVTVRYPAAFPKLLLRQGGCCPPPSSGPAEMAEMTANLFEPLLPTAISLELERGTEIVAQGGHTEHCFQVVSGCIRTVRLMEDGRRQIGEFLLAGDVLGLDSAEEHEFSADAVTRVTLRCFKRAAIEDRCGQDVSFSRNLRHYSASQARLVRGRLVLLGRMTAIERVAHFLLEMYDRLPRPGGSQMELPMSRSDMGDYLGLTIETVSRGLTELREIGAIAALRTHIVIRDYKALCKAASVQRH